MGFGSVVSRGILIIFQHNYFKNSPLVLIAIATTFLTGCPDGFKSPAGTLSASQCTETQSLQPDRFIIGGSETTSRSFMISLQSVAADRHICGASLIASGWALTAAHCVDGTQPSQIRLEIGSNDLGMGQKVNVDEIILHPELSLDFETEFANDIALLRLSEEVEDLAPVAIDLGLLNSQINQFNEFELLGWGDTEIGDGLTLPNTLQRGIVDTVNPSVCENLLGFFNSDLFLCFVDTSETQGSCNGDSGGPAVAYLQNGTPVQVGLTSFGFEGCSPDLPSVYTRVQTYIPWITEYVELPSLSDLEPVVDREPAQVDVKVEDQSEDQQSSPEAQGC
ncbi:MAG: hypothetical protein CL677_05430 [Bdellovibrionaceae bacterium]|nr:hypothetical protein [Pseudobdellovibrionaceae bacterium]|tara:strand:- start:24528 stop:25535 length:1008 start_codon:yes stop_codon:yes gene_type:complete